MGENKRVFLDIGIDGNLAGRIEIELFCGIAPMATENFRALCTGECGKTSDGTSSLSYKGSNFHRIIKGFMIQGGDITHGNGHGGCSVFGKYFNDEEFVESHSRPYMVSMANKGPNTNSSQFFITTAKAHHCDGKHVVFGKVVRGFSVVDKIEVLKTNDNGKPECDVTIMHCGQLIKKSKEKKEKDGEEEEEKKKKEMEEAEKEVEKIPEGPRSWLDRVGQRKDEKKDKKHTKRRRSNSRTRHQERRRPFRRGRSRERSDEKVNDNGIRVKGRGFVQYKKSRSVTPIHWKLSAPKKMKIEEKEEKSNHLEEYI